mmetsp:Transcript_9193/g.29840  ORF Transcript_9193/g.29840 Transcript_9193/m.29840 type:complete len:118 (-) Transcript_9193:215-568(-)
MATNGDASPTFAPTSTEEEFDPSLLRLLVIWVVQLVVIVLMMVLLKLLLQMANEFIEGRETRRSSSPQAKDNFRNRDEGQGWSWDFAVVVNVEDEGHFEVPAPSVDRGKSRSLLGML